MLYRLDTVVWLTMIVDIANHIFQFLMLAYEFLSATKAAPFTIK
jgi:hypothetical protein